MASKQQGQGKVVVVLTEKDLIASMANGAKVTVTKQNLGDVMAEAIKQVELAINLTGVEKRRLVLNALHQLVQEQPDLSASERASLSDTVLYTLPRIIDLVVNPASLGLNLARAAVRCCAGSRRKRQ